MEILQILLYLNLSIFGYECIFNQHSLLTYGIKTENLDANRSSIYSNTIFKVQKYQLTHTNSLLPYLFVGCSQYPQYLLCLVHNLQNRLHYFSYFPLLKVNK